MKSQYHREITVKALSPFFSQIALEEIVRANLRQDRPLNQVGHDYIHFDGSAFDEGFAYIREQQENLIDRIQHGDFMAARRCFGRITHSWQDYYSHSNYVRLWHATHPESPPEKIDPADPNIMAHKDLASGRNYGLPEFLAMIPGLDTLIIPRMPADSHAKMNLDSPASGLLFAFNFQAALKRTRLAYRNIIASFKSRGFTRSGQIDPFHGKNTK
ncbi:MAG: hypothetical protein SVR81_00075 [Chloroflexota bacterium]|nr:hypothetical protein [Chloroflexota bacterium]